MTAAEFDAILKARLAKIASVLAAKAGEYASEADCLHNFKRGGQVRGKTPFDACEGYMTKHVVSVYDLIERAARGERVDPAVVDEKVGDAINYLILLEALFAET